MRNLIRFIATYRLAFLFILLQLSSFVLLFRSNSYQNAVLFHSAHSYIGSFYEWKSNVTHYFELRKKNERLTAENKRLRKKLLRYQEKTRFKIPVDKDSAYSKRFKVRGARIVNSTFHRRTNHLTIDRGRKAGIEKDMGVVGPNGIVGMVRNVSEHFATVLPILNTNFRASVKLENSNAIGLLKWNGEGSRTASMVDVAQYIEVRKGDSVVTRGAASIFPEGIPVGVVRKVQTAPSKNYHNIEVKLSTDLSKTRHIYVIEDQLKEEQKGLEQKIQGNVQ